MSTGPKDTMGDDFELLKTRLERVGDEAGSFCGVRSPSDRLVEEWKCQTCCEDFVFQHCSHAAEVRFLKL